MWYPLVYIFLLFIVEQGVPTSVVPTGVPFPPFRRCAGVPASVVPTGVHFPPFHHCAGGSNLYGTHWCTFSSFSSLCWGFQPVWYPLVYIFLLFIIVLGVPTSVVPTGVHFPPFHRCAGGFNQYGTDWCTFPSFSSLCWGFQPVWYPLVYIFLLFIIVLGIPTSVVPTGVHFPPFHHCAGGSNQCGTHWCTFSSFSSLCWGFQPVW